jgi:ComF family protein
MSENMPILPQKTVITHLPTASSRIRLRGYDQAQLIAKRLAKSRGLEYQDLLRRSGRSRQVGSSKKDRFKQLSGAFSAKQPRKIKGKHILLVDDVLTTGASIESAARELKACGAKRIEAAVFARS